MLCIIGFQALHLCILLLDFDKQGHRYLQWRIFWKPSCFFFSSFISFPNSQVIAGTCSKLPQQLLPMFGTSEIGNF